MKCAFCESKKSKRHCLLKESGICSECCGTNRKKEACVGCQYYQEPKRNYKDVPAYMPSDMDGFSNREKIANTIESALTEFDHEAGNKMQDAEAIQIIERLMDFYHFQISYEMSDTPLHAGYRHALKIINADHRRESHIEITKILGAIYFVARRRTNGRREYLNFIGEYVGTRAGSGMRLLRGKNILIAD